MRFAGYVGLNRGLIEHTIDGRMTNNEALVFVWLLMLADRKSGGYTINGPTLRVFLPGLSKSAAQRALEGLERKRYIFRDITPRSPLVYPFFIDGFRITDGPHKMRQLDLSEVFATKDISKLKYVKSAPEGEPAMHPEGEPEGAKYNKTGEQRLDKQTKTSSENEASYEAHSDAQREASSEARHDATHEASRSHVKLPVKLANEATCEAGERSSAPELPPGYELREGYAGVAVYGPSGLKLSPTDVSNLYREQLQ
jgi:hypothetical protein